MFQIKTCLLFPVFLAFFSILQAQDSAELMIKPNRPGGTVRPAKLDKSVLNFEFGATYDSFNKKNSNIYGQNYAGIVRYGLLENLEVNMAFGYGRLSGDGLSTNRGLTALTPGIKIGVAEEDGSFPQMEFEGKITLPWFGDEAFRPADAEPYFNFNFANTISDLWTINYGVGMFWEGSEEAGLYGFMLIRTFTPKISAYAEHYGNIRGDINLEPHLGIGLMYLVNNKMQVDFSLDIGRDDGAVLRFFDIGLATMLVSGE